MPNPTQDFSTKRYLAPPHVNFCPVACIIGLSISEYHQLMPTINRCHDVVLFYYFFSSPGGNSTRVDFFNRLPFINQPAEASTMIKSYTHAGVTRHTSEQCELET